MGVIDMLSDFKEAVDLVVPFFLFAAWHTVCNQNPPGKMCLDREVRVDLGSGMKLTHLVGL
jgi:hypothetical protein